MEDKKNAMRLDDEQLEQVAGGWAECPIYQELLIAKNDGGGDRDISSLADRSYRGPCMMARGSYNCYGCPVATEWRFGR